MSRVAARCPSCQSVFFVSAAQGKVANNLVRCGRCGHLFGVSENLSDSPPEVEAISRSPEITIESEPAAADELNDSEEAFTITEEVEEEGSGENSVVSGDAPVSIFDLSKLAKDLPDDFQFGSAVAEKQGFRRQFSLVLAIAIVTLIGVGGQFVFFKLPTLSQQLAYRPWLERFCALLSCELDEYSARGLISVEHLQVRAHPDLEGILMVELVLINTASIGQAYPPLLLRFEDLSGEPVAARRLFAVDYLPRSLRADRLMPVDKAVSIKLAIVDPGERALSYSVTVVE